LEKYQVTAEEKEEVIIMESLQKIETLGSLHTYRVTAAKTLAELIQEIHMESKFFTILVDGKKADLSSIVQKDAEITILPKIAGGGRAKRKVKTKDKRERKPRNKNKGPMWSIEGDKVIRVRKSCPKCGPGVFMAEHYDRMHCGNCGYTMFKRTGKEGTSKRKPEPEIESESELDSIDDE